MEVLTISTGSKGNCYVLKPDDGKPLVLEAGVSLRELQQALDWDLDVAGCVVTHSHGDHAKYMYVYEHRGVSILRAWNVPYQKCVMGGWKIHMIEVEHDVPNRMLLLEHKGKRIMYVTDANEIPVKWDCDLYMIEANYDEDVLNEKALAGRVPTIVRNRVLQSHLSIEYTRQYLAKCVTKRTRGIMLVHLSDSNSMSAEFQTRIERETGIPTYIARPGLTVKI